MTRRTLSRKDLSRTLVMYGAFTASAVIMDGDDKVTLDCLHRLRAKLDDERGVAVERVIRELERIVASEGALPRSIGSFQSGQPDLADHVDEVLADGFGRR